MINQDIITFVSFYEGCKCFLCILVPMAVSLGFGILFTTFVYWCCLRCLLYLTETKHSHLPALSLKKNIPAEL